MALSILVVHQFGSPDSGNVNASEIILEGTFAVKIAGATVTVGVAVDSTLEEANAVVAADTSDSVAVAEVKSADEVPSVGMT